MRKLQELINRDSCLNKAGNQEMLFVLLSRDPTAPAVIRFWIKLRQELGLNKEGDEKLIDAEKVAKTMEFEKDTYANK